MKNFLILSLILIFTCTGCATKEDLRRSEGLFGMKLATLQKDLSKLQEATGENSEFIKSARKSQADIGADVIDLRNSIQKLRGATESLKVTVETLESKKKLENLNGTLVDISNRLAYLESYLSIDKGGGKKENSGKESPTPIKNGGATGREEAYSNAYSIFKTGEYGLAKEAFRKFLKSFPDTEYSDNAQFWIGECDYFEGKYEEAIVEYEGVIQNYPKGNKVPNTFLKQALSFLKLGDKSSAKLLLQRVIKDYPNTTPARIARKKLIDIK
ncbi:MAG: tol-pal system protein YbgF [Deltaproteobacteria bacterium]|nr:tol-pal system protein YbgF [Deltaproteobacteria bacterium]